MWGLGSGVRENLSQGYVGISVRGTGGLESGV